MSGSNLREMKSQKRQPDSKLMQFSYEYAVSKKFETFWDPNESSNIIETVSRRPQYLKSMFTFQRKESQKEHWLTESTIEIAKEIAGKFKKWFGRTTTDVFKRPASTMRSTVERRILALYWKRSKKSQHMGCERAYKVKPLKEGAAVKWDGKWTERSIQRYCKGPRYQRDVGSVWVRGSTTNSRMWSKNGSEFNCRQEIDWIRQHFNCTDQTQRCEGCIGHHETVPKNLVDKGMAERLEEIFICTFLHI